MALPDPKRFVTLVRVRKNEEESRARDLGNVRRIIANAENDRKRMEEEQQRIFHDTADRTRETFDASDIQRYHQYARHLAQRIDEKQARVAELRKEEKKRLDALRRAVQHRRIAERLDERAAEAFDEFVDRETRKQYDEAATTRAWLANKRTDV